MNNKLAFSRLEADKKKDPTEANIQNRCCWIIFFLSFFQKKAAVQRDTEEAAGNETAGGVGNRDSSRLRSALSTDSAWPRLY